MARETNEIRHKTRRLKDLAITKAIEILENPGDYSKELYESTFLSIIKNAVPRTQEVTGEDGAPLMIEISEAIARKNNIVINAPNDSNTLPDDNSSGHPSV